MFYLLPLMVRAESGTNTNAHNLDLLHFTILRVIYSFDAYSGDSTELLYLRARQYAPSIGRFITKDTWRGNTNSPLSLNYWNYVRSNPINYLDPTGHYWWGAGETLYENSSTHYHTQNVHVRIQALWMAYRMDQVHAEYIVPGTNLPVDLMSSFTGEIWEIKPWADKDFALPEAILRVVGMNTAKSLDLLQGMTPIATYYNWNLEPRVWRRGFSFPNQIYIGTDETGMYDIWAGQTQPGVIAWWKYNRKKPIDVPVPIYLPWPMKKSQRNERPHWNPPSGSPVPVPSYSSDVQAACVMGGTVIISGVGTVLIILDPVPGDEVLIPII
jgi:RHS repeat-associated protein